MDKKKYFERKTAIKTTWMILEGLGYKKQDNAELAKTVEDVYDTAPTANVQPVLIGRWERVGNYDKWRCSNCKEENLYAYSYGDDDYELQDFYCPHCGAKLKSK